MTDTNRYLVSISKVTRADSEPALLETMAHTITLSTDGTLTVKGEKQERVFRPGMWDSYTVKWIDSQPPLRGEFDDEAA